MQRQGGERQASRSMDVLGTMIREGTTHGGQQRGTIQQGNKIHIHLNQHVCIHRDTRKNTKANAFAKKKAEGTSLPPLCKII